MKQGLTHIIFVVDRSGSMQGIAKDMIGGYNTFIQTQKELSAECFVSFYQFDDIYETVFERTPLAQVQVLDAKTYLPRGSTALYDAIGFTIDSYGKYLAELPEEERPDRILFVTITDGLNNASKTFTVEAVRDKIKHQTENYKWDFVFLGSNIDAWSAGESLGVAADSTLQMSSVADSYSKGFDSLGKNTQVYRTSAAPGKFSFCAADYDAQDQFLDGEQKSKNKKQAKSSPTSTK